jgi:hypothetical protein
MQTYPLTMNTIKTKKKKKKNKKIRISSWNKIKHKPYQIEMNNDDFLGDNLSLLKRNKFTT